MSEPQIIISHQSVQDLLGECITLRKDRDAIDRKIAELERRIDAIRILAPQFFVEDRATIQFELDGGSDNDPPKGQSRTLVEAVIKAVENASTPLSPKDIRKAVKAQGDGHLIANENYIYTAIKRAADNSSIAKIGDGYVSF